MGRAASGLELAVGAPRPPGRRVESKVGDGQHRVVGLPVGLGSGPTQERPHPGQQLLGVERLGQVVIRAGVEPRDPIGGLGARRQHEDRHPVALGSQHPTDGQTVDGRHHQVEDQQVDGAGSHPIQRRGPGRGGRHPVSLESEQAVEGAAHVPIRGALGADGVPESLHQEDRRLSEFAHAAALEAVLAFAGLSAILVKTVGPQLTELMASTPMSWLVVLGLFFAHTIEVWLWAIAFWTLNAIPNFETALYFSATTFSTLGYSDVHITDTWRLLASLEGIDGFLLIGWSTALIFEILRRSGHPVATH